MLRRKINPRIIVVKKQIPKGKLYFFLVIFVCYKNNEHVYWGWGEYTYIL